MDTELERKNKEMEADIRLLKTTVAEILRRMAKEPVSQANAIDSLADAHAMTILQDAGILSEKA
jgi:hypothetical protein